MTCVSKLSLQKVLLLSIVGCAMPGLQQANDKTLNARATVFDLSSPMVPQSFTCGEPLTTEWCRPMITVELVEPEMVADSMQLRVVVVDEATAEQTEVPVTLSSEEAVKRVGFEAVSRLGGTWPLVATQGAGLVRAEVLEVPYNRFTDKCVGECGEVCGNEVCPLEGASCDEVQNEHHCVPEACAEVAVEAHSCDSPQRLTASTGRSLTLRDGVSTFSEYTPLLLVPCNGPAPASPLLASKPTRLNSDARFPSSMWISAYKGTGCDVDPENWLLNDQLDGYESINRNDYTFDLDPDLFGRQYRRDGLRELDDIHRLCGSHVRYRRARAVRAHHHWARLSTIPVQITAAAASTLNQGPRGCHHSRCRLRHKYLGERTRTWLLRPESPSPSSPPQAGVAQSRTQTVSEDPRMD